MDHDQEKGGWDQEVRCYVYDYVMREGMLPSVAGTATGLGQSFEQVAAAFRRLAHAHMLVLQPGTGEIRMANPFSAVPTSFKAHAGGHTLYGNCIWDGLGIFAMLHQDGRLETSCGCCGTALPVTITGGTLNAPEGVAHFAIPAAHWWDDIVTS